MKDLLGALGTYLFLFLAIPGLDHAQDPYSQLRITGNTTGFATSPEDVLCAVFALPEKNAGDSVKTVLDSTVVYSLSGNDSVPHDRTQYHYDINGRLISYIIQQYSASDGRWNNTEKNEYAYNEDGKKTKDITYKWDPEKKRWQIDLKWTYGYDDAGRWIFEEGYWWIEYTGQLEGLHKWEREYSDDGKVKNYTTYKWDEDGSKWEPDRRSDFFYTDTSIISVVYQWPDNGVAWKKVRKEEKVYNKYKNTYEYRTETGHWFLSEREEYEYNETGDSLRSTITYHREWPDTVWHNASYRVRVYTGRQLTDTLYVWDEKDSVWTYSELMQNKYDEAHRYISAMFYQWDGSSGSWLVIFGCEKTYDEAGNRTSFASWTSHIDYRRTYEYDVQNRLVAEEFFLWDNDLQDLVPSKRKEYGYNEDDKVLFRLEYSWNSGENDWKPVRKCWYYYSSFSGIDDLKTQGWKIYPNPASDHIVIEPEGNISVALRLVFINLGGQAVKEVAWERAAMQEVIPTGDLKQGYYLIRLYSGETLLGTQKIVIQR